MLEGLRSERRWQWAAYGKHPVAKDYFKVGQDFPLLNSFSGWIESGYEKVASKNKSAGVRRSWRFWTREARRENVVCGVLRDSTDSFGRPYPLLIMGTGPLKDWVNEWDLVPLACENTWGQIEYLLTRTFSDLKKLEEEVQNIRPPAAEWSELAKRRESFKGLTSRDLGRLNGQTSSLSESMERFILLDQGPSHDQFELIGLCHLLVKSRTEMAPNAIFMGGTLEKTYCAFFRRPLAPSDFIQLWSVPAEG
jgi:type VI secretion system protein VasJ